MAGLAIASVMAACSNSANEAEVQQAKQYTIDSMKQVTAQKEAEARAAEAKRNSSRSTTVYKSYSNPSTTTTSTRDAHDRPGWSNKAKGAVIGGVVGGGVGYGVGRGMDKKDGRY